MTATPPGWYPDPWQQGPWRWHDGKTWTPHLGGGAPGPAVTTPEQRRQLVASAKTWGERVGLAVAVQPLVLGVSAVALGLWLNGFFGEFRDYLDAQSQFPAGTAEPPNVQGSGWFALVSIAGLMNYVVLGLRMVWLHQATAAARSLGRPTKREAGLACAGWLIPIVNLWWPLESMGDLFAPGTKPRRRLGWWWALHLLAGFAAVVGLLGLAGTAPLLVGVGIAVAISAGAAWLERNLVRDVLRQLAGEVASA